MSTEHEADEATIEALADTLESIGVWGVHADFTALSEPEKRLWAARAILAAGFASPAQVEAERREAGFRKRFVLVGHPAYPDPLEIHPPTEENATRIYEECVAPSFEEYTTRLGHVPFRFPHEQYTAETFNPQVLVTWEYVGEREVFVPAPKPEASA